MGKTDNKKDPLDYIKSNDVRRVSRKRGQAKIGMFVKPVDPLETQKKRGHKKLKGVLDFGRKDEGGGTT